MNDYFKTFQNINQSAAQMTVDSSSIEIKQSAAKLKESVQPCFEELRQSANKLKELVKVSFAELEHAEDVWNSKPRIAQAPTIEILEQIGELAGCEIKITKLGKQCKVQAIKQAKESWDKRIEKLRLKWFIDSKNNLHRKGFGWSDKEGFIKDIRHEFEEQLLELIMILKQCLSLVYQEITIINLELIQQCVTILERQLQAEVSKKIELVTREIENKFSNSTNHQRENFDGVNNTLNCALDISINLGLGDIFWETFDKLKIIYFPLNFLINQVMGDIFGDIFWEQVEKCKDNVSAKIEEEINSIFDHRIELVTTAIAQAIAFYNDFLENPHFSQTD
ncbi:MAG TPA: hypothetical protein V6D09_23825 [Leptolyngbyaceae cyanobacterium]